MAEHGILAGDTLIVDRSCTPGAGSIVIAAIEGELTAVCSPPSMARSSKAKGKPDPVAMKIVEALAGFENDPKFNLGNHGYTLRRAKGKGASGFIAYKNEKPKET